MKAKKLLTLMIAGMMILSSFAACQARETSSYSEAEKSSESSASTEESSKEEAPTNMDGDVELSAPGEFPIVIGDMVDISIFTAPTSDLNTEFDSSVNTFSKRFEEDTNVHINWSIVTAADKTAKLNLLFTSDNYEDIIFDPNWSAALQYSYAQQGYLLPLNDYLENDAYYWNMYKDLGLKEGEFTQTNLDSLLMPDGNYYAMGGYSNAFHGLYSSRAWIYEPWLDAVGMETPTTTDELYTVLKAFKTEDPNGNGEADEIPLAGYMTGWNTDPTDYLFNSFVYYPVTRIYAEDGEVVLTYATDAYKEGIKYMNKLSEEGLFYTDTFTQDANAMRVLTTGETQMVGLSFGGSIPAFSQAASTKEGDWTNWMPLAPLEGPDGVQYARYTEPNFDCGATITDACEYPRVAFRIIDALYKEEYVFGYTAGTEGVHYKYCTDGEIALNGKEAIYQMLYNQSSSENTAMNYMWGQIGPATIPPTYHSNQAVMGEDPELDLEVKLYRAAEAYSEFKPAADMLVPPLLYTEEQNSEVVDYEFNLTTYVDEMVADFIINGNVDERWDEYMASLENLGANELQAIYQEAYESRMETLSK